MKNPLHRSNPWESAARIVLAASLAWYAAFWLADALRPGFVSRYLSVHWFLLVALACAGWLLVLGVTSAKWTKIPRAWLLLALPAGLLAGWVAWRVGAGAGEYRVLLALLAFTAPFALSHVRHSS